MRDKPDIRDLLETARGTLMETLLPNLPPEHRYRAHLVGAAMATAARELEHEILSLTAPERNDA